MIEFLCLCREALALLLLFLELHHLGALQLLRLLHHVSGLDHLVIQIAAVSALRKLLFRPSWELSLAGGLGAGTRQARYERVWRRCQGCLERRRYGGIS